MSSQPLIRSSLFHDRSTDLVNKLQLCTLQEVVGGTGRPSGQGWNVALS